MFLELNFRSSALGKETQVSVLLPDGAQKPYKTLWLLHGLHGDHTSYMRKTSIERYAAAHKIAVIMPNADRSWYTNTVYGANYFDFVANELPEFCACTFSGIDLERENNIVAGLSMGGYGAMKLALTCPDRYATCISLSGSLDITRKGRTCNLPEWRSIFNYDMQSPLELEGSEHDLFALVKKQKESGVTLPKLYMWCGTEDSLVRVNRDFSAHLFSLGIDHVYEESEGDHSWQWWDIHAKNALDKMLGI